VRHQILIGFDTEGKHGNKKRKTSGRSLDKSCKGVIRRNSGTRGKETHKNRGPLACTTPKGEEGPRKVIAPRREGKKTRDQ